MAESGSPAEPAKDVSARERWRQIIRLQRQSELTIAEFCRQRLIRTATFYSWRKKLEAPGPRASAEAGGFVAVKLAARVSGLGAAAPAGGRLEVRLRAGRRVIVRRGFDRPLLVELIGVLEGLA